jgi:senataxin
MAEFLELGNYILNPARNFSTSASQVPPSFFESIEKHFNASQRAAIVKVCEKDKGFTLLQGPPGTGKTHTIIGILSAFINGQALSGDKPYILVCAPSNAAIDEVATRVVKCGLID